MEAITTALTGAITTIGSDATAMIASVLPVALPIMGAVLVTSIGVKVFKRFTK